MLKTSELLIVPVDDLLTIWTIEAKWIFHRSLGCLSAKTLEDLCRWMGMDSHNKNSPPERSNKSKVPMGTALILSARRHVVMKTSAFLDRV